MKYTKEERIDIGRKVYTRELTELEACVQYQVGRTSIQKYVKFYKESKGIPVVTKKSSSSIQPVPSQSDIDSYRQMSKDELINELIKSKINEARAKKGYEVKGDGAEREYVSLNNKNTKS